MEIKEILISVVITSYNRYDRLIDAINSVKRQTYKNIEIIVVNDKSTEQKYYNSKPSGVTWIDLEQSSREIFGYPAVGYTRNVGLSKCKGEYVAFLDDDDFWIPEKITTQLNLMLEKGFEFSCTEAFMFDSPYVEGGNYKILHREYFKVFCAKFFDKNYSGWTGTLPEVFDLKLIRQHNFIIHSSVLIKKSLLEKSGFYKESNPQHTRDPEDWELWRRVLTYSDCLSINEPLIYYFVKETRLSLIMILKIKLRRGFRRVFG